MKKYHYNPTKPHHYFIAAIVCAPILFFATLTPIMVGCFIANVLGGVL